MRTTLRIGILLFTFFLFLYTLTLAGHFFSQDGEILYRAAASFYGGEGGAVENLDGDTVVVGEDGRVYHVPVRGWGTMRGLDGREYPQYGAGQPLLAVPLVGAGRVCADLLPESLERSFDHVYTPFQYHVRTWPEWIGRFTVSRFNQIVSAAAVAVLYLFAVRLWGDHRAAIVTAALYGLATAAWVQSRTFFTEPLAGLCVLIAFFFAERCRAWAAEGSKESVTRGLRRAGWGGLAFGYALLTRPDSLLFLPGLLLLLVFPRDDLVRRDGWFRALASSARRRDVWLRLLWFGVPAGLFGLVMAWVNLARFGSLFATGYSDQPEGIEFRLPIDGISGFLFSPGKSIFVYSPAVLVALFGWKRFLREHRRVALSLAAGIVFFFLFEASWQNWEGGWCWGPRHIFQATALLMVGAAPLFLPGGVRWTPAKRAAAGAAIALGALVQVVGVSGDFVKALHLLSPAEVPMTIYNPAYSHIALHLRMLVRGDHDLFLLHLVEANPPIYWVLPALAVLAAALFGVLLAREWRRAGPSAMG